jgi:hypothetical protein
VTVVWQKLALFPGACRWYFFVSKLLAGISRHLITHTITFSMKRIMYCRGHSATLVKDKDGNEVMAVFGGRENDPLPVNSTADPTYTYYNVR